MKQRMKEEGHRIRLRILLDFLPEDVDRKELERLYFSPGIDANDKFVEYLESRLDDSQQDQELKIAMDEERQQIRLEELKEFNKITKREKKSAKFVTASTQTHSEAEKETKMDCEIQEKKKRDSCEDEKKESKDTPHEDLVIKVFDSKDKKGDRDEASPDDASSKFKLAAQPNPFAFNPALSGLSSTSLL